MMDTIIDTGAMVLAATVIGLGALGVMHWLETRLPVRHYAKRDRMREMMLARRKGSK